MDLDDAEVVGTTKFGKPLKIRQKPDGLFYIVQVAGGSKARRLQGVFLSYDDALHAIQTYEREVKYYGPHRS